jgi:hypothetical protein
MCGSRWVIEMNKRDGFTNAILADRDGIGSGLEKYAA